MLLYVEAVTESWSLLAGNSNAIMYKTYCVYTNNY